MKMSSTFPAFFSFVLLSLIWLTLIHPTLGIQCIKCIAAAFEKKEHPEAGKEIPYQFKGPTPAPEVNSTDCATWEAKKKPQVDPFIADCFNSTNFADVCVTVIQKVGYTTFDGEWRSATVIKRGCRNNLTSASTTACRDATKEQTEYNDKILFRGESVADYDFFVKQECPCTTDFCNVQETDRKIVNDGIKKWIDNLKEHEHENYVYKAGWDDGVDLDTGTKLTPIMATIMMACAAVLFYRAAAAP